MSLIASLLVLASATSARADGITRLDPPEQGFYAKELDYQGISIKASAAVSDDALVAAYARLYMMLHLLPTATENLKAASAELHIIGAKQSTSDLPENRELKGKPFDGDLDVDQRTRGLGGIAASCGEENLLGLAQDRYRGRDICVHEFAHTLHIHGLSKDLQDKIARQFEKSTAAGLWKGLYASTNEREYFAELAMWYFGTHGDMDKLAGARPGAAWLKSYDPDGYDLVDGIFTGRFEVARRKVVPLQRLPPDKEPELRAYNGEPVAVTFWNKTSRPVRIYWLDYEGHRKSYGTISPGGRHEQQTFETHPFVLTDERDRALAIFVAGSETALATLDEPGASSR